MTYFYVCAALAVLGALATVSAKNPIRGAMGLLLLILSIAGLFLALHAQFLAAIQLIVYAGAIVVLFLFVIMLLGPSAVAPQDNKGVVARTIGGGVFAASALGAMYLVVRGALESKKHLPMPNLDPGFGGIERFGAALFTDALVPFEFSSALLMVAALGAVAVARGRQGVKAAPKASQPKRTVAVGVGEASGVFRHEIQAESTPALPGQSHS
jgi:NADH-quinone oxidoreductase subunit J